LVGTADVLSWEVPVSAGTPCCAAALDCALQQGPPEIFNMDQGAQFTGKAFKRDVKRNRFLNYLHHDLSKTPAPRLSIYVGRRRNEAG